MPTLCGGWVAVSSQWYTRYAWSEVSSPQLAITVYLGLLALSGTAASRAVLSVNLVVIDAYVYSSYPAPGRGLGRVLPPSPPPRIHSLSIPSFPPHPPYPPLRGRLHGWAVYGAAPCLTDIRDSLVRLPRSACENVTSDLRLGARFGGEIW